MFVRPLLKALLNSRQFVESIISWIFIKLINSFVKKLGEVQNGNSFEQDLNKYINTINRIQESLNVTKAILKALLEKYECKKCNKINTIPKKLTSNSIKSFGDSSLVNVGLKTLNAWSKKNTTPIEYRELEKLLK